MNLKKILIVVVLVVGLIFAYMVSQPFGREISPVLEQRVAVIELDGVISYSTSPLIFYGKSLTPDEVREMVDQVKDDPSVKAVVLQVNSPGGSAAATEEIYQLIRKLAEEKVVIAYIAEYGASGGYYISLPAKKIVANPSAMTGSVGAVSVILNYAGLFKKIGLKAYTFKSNELKDVGSPYRNMTEAEKEVLQSIVDSTYQQFRGRVLEHRGMIIDEAEVFTGRPFSGVQAKRVGLVDEVGTFEDALRMARQEAGLPEDAPYFVVERPRPGLLELLFGEAPSTRIKVSYEVLLMWPLPADIDASDLVYIKVPQG